MPTRFHNHFSTVGRNSCSLAVGSFHLPKSQRVNCPAMGCEKQGSSAAREFHRRRTRYCYVRKSKGHVHLVLLTCGGDYRCLIGHRRVSQLHPRLHCAVGDKCVATHRPVRRWEKRLTITVTDTTDFEPFSVRVYPELEGKDQM
jgi:hypothetical protein